jgi:hypothetical protein
MATLDFDDLDDLKAKSESEVLEGILEPAQVVKPRALSVALQKAEQLAMIRDEIQVESGRIVMDGLAFAKLTPDQEGPSAEWIAQMGPDRAWERFRTARYNLMNNQEAPVGTKLAMQIYSGIIRAQATEKGAPVRLNVEKVILNVNPRIYPELELENGS